MTMHEILELSSKRHENEYTCIDKDYDVEFYCYSSGVGTDDNYYKCYERLSKLLQVTKIFDRGDTIVFETNLNEIISKALATNKSEAIGKLWYKEYCNIDSIMDEIESDLAGNVSEEGTKNFVDGLEKSNKGVN